MVCFFGIVGDGWSQVENIHGEAMPLIELTAKPSFLLQHIVLRCPMPCATGKTTKNTCAFSKIQRFAIGSMLLLMSCRFELFHFSEWVLKHLCKHYFVNDLGKPSLPGQSVSKVKFMNLEADEFACWLFEVYAGMENESHLLLMKQHCNTLSIYITVHHHHLPPSWCYRHSPRPPFPSLMRFPNWPSTETCSN